MAMSENDSEDEVLGSSEVTIENLKNTKSIFYGISEPTPLAEAIWKKLIKPNLKCKGEGYDPHCEEAGWGDNQFGKYEKGPIESCDCHDCGDTLCTGLGIYVKLRDTEKYKKLLKKWVDKLPVK